MAGLGSKFDQFGIGQDDSQNVVEVVSNAACQRADRFHLLGSRNLLNQMRAFGHVLDNAGVTITVGNAAQQGHNSLIRGVQELSFKVLNAA